MNRWLRRFSVALCGLLMLPQFAFAQQYDVVDLGVHVFPLAINKQGVVVGIVQNPANDPVAPFAEFPFIWQNGILTRIAPAGWLGGALYGINAAGTAVGQASLPNGTMPFKYENGAISAIPVGNAFGGAGAITDTGVIGGFVQADLGGGLVGDNVPFVIENGNLTLLPALGGTGGGVVAINSAGLAVGGVLDPSSATVAVSWENHVLHILPQLGGNNSSANAVNDSGVIAGSTSTPTQVLPNLFETHAAIWKNGVLTDLGGIPGANFTTARGISPSGQIVGSSTVVNSESEAFLYENGSMKTLNDLAGAATGWRFQVAHAINDSNQIVGLGAPPGAVDPIDVHGFVLTISSLTPVQMLDQLTQAVDALGLSKGAATSLKSKLAAARDSVLKNVKVACGPLGAFVNEVKAQSGKALTAAQGASLLAQAKKIATAIGC